MKKIRLSLLTILLLSVLSVAPTFADGSNIVFDSPKTAGDLIITPNFVSIMTFSNDFSLSSQGKASVTSYVTAIGVNKCSITVDLQRYVNGSWTTIKTWTETNNNSYCSLGKSYYVASGYQYRMTAYASVYNNGSFIEQTIYTSGTRVY